MRIQLQAFPLALLEYVHVKTTFQTVVSPCTIVPYTIYPGETFQVFVVAVGQRSGIVPTAVRSSAMNIAQYDIAGDFHHSQYIQQVDKTCTKLNYTVFSLSQGMMIGLP